MTGRPEVRWIGPPVPPSHHGKTRNPKEEYIVPGGMYRGEPPLVYSDYACWDPDVHGDASDACMMDILKSQQQQQQQQQQEKVTTFVIRGGSSSSGKDVVGPSAGTFVWEYTSDAGVWTPYDTVSQKLIEDAYQTMFVTFATNSWTYQVDVVNMVQTNTQHAAQTQRHVRRSDKNNVWEFLDDTGWQAYDIDTQSKLETSFQRIQNGSPKAVVQSDDRTYAVDVVEMIQLNTATHKTRPVRRTIVPALPATDPDSATNALTDHGSTDQGVTATTTPKRGSSRPWRSVLDPRCFLPARAKSKQRNVNNNHSKDGYVFGRASGRTEYFSLETKEAWEIVAIRLGKRADHARSKYESFECVNCLCCGCTPSSAQVQQMESHERKWQRYEYMMAFALAKKDTYGPDETPNPDLIRQYRNRRSGGRQRSNYTGNYTDPHYYMSYVGTAAGCGGGDGGCGAGCG